MDERSGVKAVLNSYRKKQEKLAKERVRLEEMRSYEHQYERYGYVCGIDEAGRGPLAREGSRGRGVFLARRL